MDPLEIKLEADSGGLKTQLKAAGDMLNNFVNDMTGLHVNWAAILGGAIDAALLAEVADMFAASIGQSLNFAQQTADIAGQTNTSVSQMSAIGEAAVGISDTTAASAQEVQNAIATLTPVLGGNLPAATTAATLAADLMSLGMGNVGDIVQSLIPIFHAFGVSSSADVISVMDAIFESAGTMGPNMFEPLANSVASLSGELKLGGMTTAGLPNMIATLASDANVSGLSSAAASMKMLADGATQAGSNGAAIAGLAGGVTTIRNDFADGKTSDAMASLANSVNRMKPIEADFFTGSPNTTTASF